MESGSDNILTLRGAVNLPVHVSCADIPIGLQPGRAEGLFNV